MPGMILMFVSMACFSILAQVATLSPVRESGLSNSAVTDMAVIGKYQAFVITANSYVKDHPLASGVYYWTTLKASAAAGHANTEIPSDWRVVAQNGVFSVCTSFPNEQVAIQINALMSNKTDQVNKLSSSRYVIGDPAHPNILSQESSKCD